MWGISSQLLQQTQPLLLTLDEVTPPNLEGGVAPLGPPAPMQPLLLGCGVAPPDLGIVQNNSQQQRSYPTLKVKKGSGEEIPLVQGKEQHLHFAGAAVKRYTTPKVRETQVRQ